MRSVSHALAGSFLLIALYVAPAHAQTNNKLALGLTFSTRRAPDDSSVARDGHEVQLEWRFGHTQKSSWGWHYALNWFTTDVHRQIGGGSAIDLGELRVRPLMGGYGYTMLIGRAAISAALLAGYAITSFSLQPEADDVYRLRLGAASVRSNASNTLVASPEMHVWYDINEKYGLLVSGSYLFARPEIIIQSSLGEDVHRVHADMYAIRIGVVYKIF